MPGPSSSSRGPSPFGLFRVGGGGHDLGAALLGLGLHEPLVHAVALVAVEHRAGPPRAKRKAQRFLVTSRPAKRKRVRPRPSEDGAHGTLGLKFTPNQQTSNVEVLAINLGTQAEQHRQLRAGLILKSVAGVAATGKSYRECLVMIKAGCRLLKMTFVPGGLVADSQRAARRRTMVAMLTHHVRALIVSMIRFLIVFHARFNRFPRFLIVFQDLSHCYM